MIVSIIIYMCGINQENTLKSKTENGVHTVDRSADREEAFRKWQQTAGGV